MFHPREAEPLFIHGGRDFALLRVADAPYEPDSRDPYAFVQPLRLAREPVLRDDLVPIIQHPEGEPKKVALKRFVVVEANDDEIQYYTSTSGGSSGAPVFNREFEVVGVHQRYMGMSDGKHGRNVGTPIRAVLGELLKGDPEVYEQIAAVQESL
ncbi:MAG: trypsin-like peptidase domain-containing protein [Chromatiales bacterium]|nr:trypsin-like peptidase domain-containing protein [Chromatiales bacterium]